MKKRIFSVLTALAMLLSIAPLTFAADGEIRDAANGYGIHNGVEYAYPTQTNYDAFEVTKAVEASQYYTLYEDRTDGKWTQQYSLRPQSYALNGQFDYIGGNDGDRGHYVLYKNMEFAATPEFFCLGASTDESITNASVVVSIIDSSNVETRVTEVAVPNKGWVNFEDVYVTPENTIEPGTYDVKLTFRNNGNVNTFFFGISKDAYSYVQALSCDDSYSGFNLDNADPTDHIKICSYNNWYTYKSLNFGKKGAAYFQIDFGNKEPEDTQKNFKITKGHEGTVLQDGIAIPGYGDDNANKVTSLILVDNNNFKGITDICWQSVQNMTQWSGDFYGFKFIEITDASTIQKVHTGDYDTPFYQMDFGKGGYNKIVFENLTVDENSLTIPTVNVMTQNGEVIDTITLTAGKTRYDIDGIADYKNAGIIAVENASDNSSFTGFKFEAEYDAFKTNSEIKALYIGANSESSEAVLGALRAKYADTEKTITAAFKNLSEITTKIGLIETEYSLKDGGYDMIFVEAGENCEGIVDALVGTDAYVLVVGENVAAKKYGIGETSVATISADLMLSSMYRNAVAPTYQNPYNEIVAVDNCASETTMTVISEGTGLKGENGVAVFKDIDFDKGVSEINVKAVISDGLYGTFEVFVDSWSSENLIGSFVLNQGQDWVDWQNHKKTINKEIYGVHDVWVCWAYGPGNLYSIQFEPITSEGATKTFTPEMAQDTKLYNNTIYLAGNNTAKYSVNFGETEKKYSAYASISAKEAGILYVTAGDKMWNIPFDANGDFVSEMSESDILVSGVKDVVLSSSVPCAVKSLNFTTPIDIDAEGTVLNTQNYTSTNLASAGVTQDRFGGFMDGTQYVEWKNVDFGTEQVLRNVTFSYGIAAQWQNGVMTLHLDSVDGPVIAKANAKYEDGIDWEAPVTITVPMIYGVTGTHSVYLTVEEGKYTRLAVEGDSIASNVFGIDFDLTEGNYHVNYDVATYYNSATGAYENLGYDAVLTFVGGDVEEIIFAEAFYSGNKLVDVDIKKHTVKSGEVNQISLSVKNNELPAGEYSVKGFVWNAQTFAPINSQTIDLGTVTVTE